MLFAPHKISVPKDYTEIPRLQGHNFLRQNLVYAQVFTGATSTRNFYNLQDNVKGAGDTSIGRFGPYLDFSGASVTNPIDYGTPVQMQDLALGAFSIVARVYVKSGSTTGGVARRNDGNTVNQGWMFNCSGSGTSLGFIQSTSNFASATSSAPPTNKFFNLAVIYHGDLTASNTPIFYDGVRPTLTTTGNGSGSQASDATRNFIIGESNVNSGGTSSGVFQGLIDVMYIWKRALRTEEVLYLVANPYSPLEIPNPLRVAAPTSAAPASGFPALFLAI